MVADGLAGRRFARFVALGDSQTEGLNDGPADAPRGWADRFAERLASTTSPSLAYANLAVRGCRAAHVRDHQLPAALDLKPDLVAIVAGMNDVLRHDYRLEETVSAVEETMAALHASGAQILTMSFPDVARMLPAMSWLRPRQIALNQALGEVARRYDAIVLDLFPLALASDAAMWSPDRIHASPEGHRRIAEGMASICGLPEADQQWAITTSAPRRGLSLVAAELHWMGTFLGPFLLRQLFGRGADVAAVPKRPALAPVAVTRR